MVAQCHIQSGFEYLQGFRLQNVSVQSAPVFDHPHIKKAFFFFNLIEFAAFQFVPIDSCVVTGCH